MSDDKSRTKTKTPTPNKTGTPARPAARAKIGPQAKTAARAKPAVRAKPAAKKTPARDLAEVVAAAAAEHQPLNPVLLDLRGLSSVADWFFIASAENPRQMAAIADKIVRRARENGFRPLGREGQGRPDERWVLLDMGEVVVHLFNLEGRKLYDLDGLWTDAPRRDLEEMK
ncbi:MAG: ribosome silencing factor [Candidatus Adiutrix sp.]|jgi:ribosome-associated protein|nr:ribosome silencing factor [Candidatus Adiutrix sp.]